MAQSFILLCAMSINWPWAIIIIYSETAVNKYLIDQDLCIPIPSLNAPPCGMWDHTHCFCRFQGLCLPIHFHLYCSTLWVKNIGYVMWEIYTCDHFWIVVKIVHPCSCIVSLHIKYVKFHLLTMLCSIQTSLLMQIVKSDQLSHDCPNYTNFVIL